MEEFRTPKFLKTIENDIYETVLVSTILMALNILVTAHKSPSDFTRE